LKAYFDRFLKAQLTIRNADDNLCLLAITQGVRKPNVVDNFHAFPPATAKEAYDRISNFIASEEQQALQASMSGTVGFKHPRSEGPSDRHDSSPRPTKKKDKGDRSDCPSYKPKFNDYTPLTLPRSDILAILDEEQPLPRPQSYRNKKKDEGSWCQYHRTRGHHTDQCKQLKDLIESKARQGELDNYIQCNNLDGSIDRQNPQNQQRFNVQEITHWEDGDYINIIEHDPNDLSTPKDSGASPSLTKSDEAKLN
jgi:Ni/Co efflux regulator RcnB